VPSGCSRNSLEAKMSERRHVKQTKSLEQRLAYEANRLRKEAQGTPQV
jgi:hypothetical protein